MKVLITGATGFIGKNLLPEVTKRDTDIWLFGRHRPEASPPNINHIHVDLSDKEAMEKIASRPAFRENFDACIHLAGQADLGKSLNNPAGDLINNVLPVINLLSLFKIKRFLYASTGSVYEGHSGMVKPSSVITPTIPYAISKYAGELYLKSFHKKHGNPAGYSILRIFSPYGPYEDSRRIMPMLIRQFGMKKNPVFEIRGSGKTIMNPMYVLDTVRAILAALHSKAHNREIDICAENPMTLVELVKTVASVFGIVPKIELSGQSNEEMTFYGNPSLQETLLGFKPRTSLRDGLLRYHSFLNGFAA